MFNISEFKARLDKHGGPGRTNLFVLEFAPRNIPTNITTDDLRFFCQSVTMPGINLETMQYRPSGIGYPEYIPINSVPDQMNAIFMLDSNHKVMTFFHRWISSVINVSGTLGDNAAGVPPKEINFKDQYETSLVIRHYSVHNPNRFYECRYDGVYPTQVSALDLSWANEGIATVTVNFTYSRMIYSGFIDLPVDVSSTFAGSQQSIAINSMIQQINQNFIDNNTIF